MLRQYFQQHIVDRAAGDLPSVVLSAGLSTKPGDSTKQLSRKASSAAAADGAPPTPSTAGDGAVIPAGRKRAAPGGPCSCGRGGVAAIHIAPGLDLSAAIREVGVRTQGFSGRELSKLVLKMQVRKWRAQPSLLLLSTALSLTHAHTRCRTHSVVHTLLYTHSLSTLLWTFRISALCRAPPPSTPLYAPLRPSNPVVVRLFNLLTGLWEVGCMQAWLHPFLFWLLPCVGRCVRNRGLGAHQGAV